MSSRLRPPYPPMEAATVAEIPVGPEWQYEPKWDGFRCVVFRDGERVDLQSKAGEPLARYFPELVDAFRSLAAPRFVLDSEIAVPEGAGLSFDQLLLRIHPSESRVTMLAREHPAIAIVFDILENEKGRVLTGLPLKERRSVLEAFARRFFRARRDLRLSPATPDLKVAQKWFRTVGGPLDGIVAKRLDMAYRSGERTGMVKIKNLRTADCVVGGFRYAAGSKEVGSLLLGLYDADGALDHVGFTSGFASQDRKALTSKVEALVEPPGFTGRAPGGPSRWSRGRSAEWQPLAPKLVVEVRYDHFCGGRFRHGTKLLRWRPDKSPRQCTMDQVAASRAVRTLKLLE